MFVELPESPPASTDLSVCLEASYFFFAGFFLGDFLPLPAEALSW